MGIARNVQRLADNLVFSALMESSSKQKGSVGEKILSLPSKQRELLSHANASHFTDSSASRLFHINDEQKLFNRIKNRR